MAENSSEGSARLPHEASGKAKQDAKGRRTCAKKALKSLSSKSVYDEPYEDTAKRLENESDRGVILMLSTFLEDALRDMIAYKLPGMRAVEWDDLFGFDASFGTFSRRIIGATALGIISPETRGLLDLIRELRNKAAHLQNDITFCEDPTRSVVLALLDQDSQEFALRKPDFTIRYSFISTCLFLRSVITKQYPGGDKEGGDIINITAKEIDDFGTFPLSKILIFNSRMQKGDDGGAGHQADGT